MDIRPLDDSTILTDALRRRPTQTPGLPGLERARGGAHYHPDRTRLAFAFQDVAPDTAAVCADGGASRHVQPSKTPRRRTATFTVWSLCITDNTHIVRRTYDRAVFHMNTTLSQEWSGNSIRGPQCAFEMSMFMCPAVHKLTRN